MISNLTITGFRAFRELRVDPLTRVNLFVGKNNAGKTSILEAVELVTLGNFEAMRRILRRREERIFTDESTELDPSHLFYGRLLGNFSIVTRERYVRCLVAQQSQQIPGTSEAIDSEAYIGLLLEADEKQSFRRLSPFGGLVLPPAIRESAMARHLSSPTASAIPVNFVQTDSVDAFRLGQLWDQVVLTPEEENIAATLRIIEQRIERIAFIGENRSPSRRIFVKLAGLDQRIPLGSVGDGLKRLLALTLNLFSAHSGYLLVDEIDTGLHHSVLMDMWKLVIETAKRLGVQVFATTHSLDCVHALAWVQEQNPDLAAEVTLHRIEKDAPATTVYSVDEIAIAERGQIEVR